MPTYDYQCKKCHSRHEISQKITAEPLKECPQCGESALERGPGGGIGLLFQGSGFYITDYGKPSAQKEEAPRCSAKKEAGGCCPCGK